MHLGNIPPFHVTLRGRDLARIWLPARRPSSSDFFCRESLLPAAAAATEPREVHERLALLRTSRRLVRYTTAFRSPPGGHRGDNLASRPLIRVHLIFSWNAMMRARTRPKKLRNVAGGMSHASASSHSCYLGVSFLAAWLL